MDKSRASKTINAGRGMSICTQNDEVIYQVVEDIQDMPPRQHHEFLAMEEHEEEQIQNPEEEGDEIIDSRTSSDLRKNGQVEKKRYARRFDIK